MKVIGHIASFLSYAIFGLNIVMCKDIANSDILTPYALFFLRALGATMLFWLCSLFVKNEHINRHDMVQIVVASFIGLLMPQMTFLVGIKQSSSIDTSLISTLSPIFTMFFAAYFIKEPITWKKVQGVIISFVGVTFLILSSIYHKNTGQSQTTITGLVLLFLNCFTFALYLGAFRPVIAKYSVINFMRWMFLYTLIMSTPFCIGDTITFISHLSTFNSQLYWEIAYVIFFATFVAYFLIPIGQKNIRPTLVSMYSYVQPVIAVIISVCIGMDTLTWPKCVAILMIFVGVAIVNHSRSNANILKDTNT